MADLDEVEALLVGLTKAIGLIADHIIELRRDVHAMNRDILEMGGSGVRKVPRTDVAQS